MKLGALHIGTLGFFIFSGKKLTLSSQHIFHDLGQIILLPISGKTLLNTLKMPGKNH